MGDDGANDPRCAWHDPGIPQAKLRPQPCIHFPDPVEEELRATIARLRAIEEAARKGVYDLAGWLALARAYGWGHPEWRVETEQIIDALHVALGETPERPTDLGQQTVYSTALGRRVTRGEAEP